MKTRYFIHIFLLINAYTSLIQVSAQDKKHEIQTANSFIKAVFISHEKARSVMLNYMYFEPNKDYSIDKRATMLKSHLKKTINEKASLFDSSNYSIIPYNIYKKEKVDFPTESENIFILESIDKKPILYMLLKKDRVFSFDYILKGSEGYFITY